MAASSNHRIYDRAMLRAAMLTGSQSDPSGRRRQYSPHREAKAAAGPTAVRRQWQNQTLADNNSRQRCLGLSRAGADQKWSTNIDQKDHAAASAGRADGADHVISTSRGSTPLGPGPGHGHGIAILDGPVI